MGKIYINQPFKIKAIITEDVDGVDTPVDITGLPVVFNYIAPDGSEVTLTPGVITDGAAGAVEYDVPVNTITEEGSYTFYAVVTFGNGEIPSEPTKVTLHTRGK